MNLSIFLQFSKDVLIFFSFFFSYSFSFHLSSLFYFACIIFLFLFFSIVHSCIYIVACSYNRHVYIERKRVRKSERAMIVKRVYKLQNHCIVIGDIVSLSSFTLRLFHFICNDIKSS